MRRHIMLGIGVVLTTLATPLGYSQWSVSGSNIFYNNGNVGIGTTNPTYRLFVQTATGAAAIYGNHIATSGAAYSIWGQTASPAGVGVYGWATASSGSTLGVYGQSNSSSGVGVYGWASAASGGTYGGQFVSSSTSGVGVYGYAVAPSGNTLGVYGRSLSHSGTGVYGWASAASGTNYGGQFVSSSTSGVGVYGYAVAPSGNTLGVYGRSLSHSGTGVYGWASAASGTNYGVYGISNSPDGFGVYAQGDLGASGLKSFCIDHPLRPETHYLLHYCTEAPEPLNAYSGIATLDMHGEAWVALPDYFNAINRDPRYTLTPIGAPMPNLHIAVEIQGNCFKIAGGVPGGRASWRVEAVRNDPYVQQRGFQAEREKPREHIGKYLHPELYGQPKERAIVPQPLDQAPVERNTP